MNTFATATPDGAVDVPAAVLAAVPAVAAAATVSSELSADVAVDVHPTVTAEAAAAPARVRNDRLDGVNVVSVRVLPRSACWSS